MILKVKHQFAITLKAEPSKDRTLWGVILLISGLVLCFVSVFLAVFGQWVLSIFFIIVGIFMALSGMPLLLKEQQLSLYRNGSRVVELNYTRYHILPATRRWDMGFVSKVEGQVTTGTDENDQIIISLKFTNGESEVVMSEPGSVLPVNCLNYVNQFIQGKEIPEGEFRD